MKKIIYVILGVLLFLPVLVKADMGAPVVERYKLTPKSPDGADIYNWDYDKEDYVKTGRKLAYGKVIEIDNDDEWVSWEDSEEAEDTVKLSDLVPVVKNYKVDEKRLSKQYEVLVTKKQDIRKGPAAGYESTGKTIPAGTKVKVKYFDPDSKGNKQLTGDTTPWVYVEYNGTKGFIVSFEGTIASDPVYTTVVANCNAEVKNAETGKKVATISPNVKFNATVYELDPWAEYYYIEYGSVKGIVNDGHIAVKRKAITFKPTEKIQVYGSLKHDGDDEKGTKVVTTITKGTSFKSEYYCEINPDGIYVYYENGNIKGWISESGHEVDPNNEDSDYIEVAKILGFTYPGENNPFIKVEKTTETTTEPEETTPVEPEPIDNTTTNDDTTNNDTPKESKGIPQIAYLCLGAAVIIFITALTTAMLINKKNNGGNNNSSNNNNNGSSNTDFPTYQ